MPIIRCPNCGQAMSNTYNVCPYCDYRLSDSQRQATTTTFDNATSTKGCAPQQPAQQQQYNNSIPQQQTYYNNQQQTSRPVVRTGKFLPGLLLGLFGGIVGFIIAVAAIRMKKTTQGALIGFIIYTSIFMIIMISFMTRGF